MSMPASRWRWSTRAREEAAQQAVREIQAAYQISEIAPVINPVVYRSIRP